MLKKYIANMKKRLNMIKDNNRGFAFVFVIVGVMAVAVIGATVLSLATNYYLSVVSDERSGESFNSAEGVLGEIRSGLEEIAGYSNEEAYLDVMENYGTSSYQGKMYKKYGIKFLTGIVNGIQGNALVNKAKVNGTITWDGIEEPESTKWHTISVDTIKKMTTRPETIKSVSLRYGFSNKSGKLSLTIKDLVIDYTDTLGYNSKVATDIVIDVPNYNFEGDATIQEMKNYISISDDILDFREDTDTNMAGNIYSGGKTGKHGESDNYETGIRVGGSAKANINSKIIISRGDLKLLTGSTVNIANEGGQQWLKNIILGEYGSSASTKTTKLDLHGNSYIIDDLSLEVNNSDVNMGGKYYGYGYSQNNDFDNDSTTESDYSSAVLVNGKNTYLTSNGLQKLILSGRTFVSKNDKEFKSVTSDIMMGESLSIKSNQIAYLLPDKYISKGVDEGRGQHNPLMIDEIFNADTLCLASGNIDVDIEALQTDLVWPYLDNNKPLIANYSNSGGYVYLYYNFKSQKDANQYFKKYCEEIDDETGDTNQDELAKKAETYISSMDYQGMKISAPLYLIAGNIIHNYYESTGSKFQSANYFNNAGLQREMVDDGQSMMRKYLGKQFGLIDSGYDKLERFNYELKPNLTEYRFENMPDDQIKDKDGNNMKPDLVRDVICDFSHAAGLDNGGDVTKYYDVESGGSVYVSDGDCRVSDTINKGIIICNGNVEVDENFVGLILASGEVFITGNNVTAKADAALVDALLSYIKDHSKLHEIIRAFTEEDKNSNLVAECFSYDNWTRNSN